ncbi:MAG: Gfo/Idh/MocA family oxidoreductase [Bacteroidales bacterium]|nr:Gfo/Idh/MocA family oxidoreductase [Bacteroidales bacterium]
MADDQNNTTENKGSDKGGLKVGRRDILKGLATVPIAGALAYGVLRKARLDRLKALKSVANELGLNTDPIVGLPLTDPDSKTINLGLIGYGIRGKQLAQALGFAHPTMVDDMISGVSYTPVDMFRKQENLNIRITAVCDIFDTYGRMARETGANVNREGSDGSLGAELPTRYRTYQELCAAPEVDAVIIAAPDHWHGPMTMEAARNGKHVYCEKPLTWTVEETYEVRKVVKESGVVFQLGHQGRQTDNYIKAKEAYEKGIVGRVNLIEVTTNRNSGNGAWVYPIHEDASEETIDWEQFIGPAPWHDFSLERFFRWRCWWDYSTGLSGDLLTHEYDALNQILDLGIPSSAVSSGGVYFFKDGRTVPDVLTTQFEYPNRNLSFMYSATLASSMDRGKKIMGHDGYMDIGRSLQIFADQNSTKYAEKIQNGEIDTAEPIYIFTPGLAGGVDGISSATADYFAARGLLTTVRNGLEVDTTHLHLKEWIDCVRTNKVPSCNIDEAFEEAMTAHMGTLAYRNNRQIFWDAANEEIII